MGKSPEQKMAMMVDAAQPHCDEPVEAAMICSHAGSTGQVLSSTIAGVGGGLTKTSELPNPVLIAVGTSTIYAFKYKPRGVKVRVKKGAEVARWPRGDLRMGAHNAGKVTQFTLVTGDGDEYPLEVITAFGGSEVVDLFLHALRHPAA